MKELFGSGFGFITFLMAQVYGMVRLLPPGHPYLRIENKGKFGIRQVLAEAANHLTLSWHNIDQIVIFVALLAGIFLLVGQVLVLAYGLLFAQAIASSAIPESYFLTQSPDRDIAFMMMDYVFGIPEIYNSCVAKGTPCADGDTPIGAVPYPFHTALHGMFEFYSTGLLIVAVLIFLYYLVIVVGESATTGAPFGQRFQNMWVPVRLVVAIGLLLPLNFGFSPVNYGLNTAQYITLYVAKYGSGFGTNAWLLFNEAIKSPPDQSIPGGQYANVFGDGGANPLGERESLLAKPKKPDFTAPVQFMAMAHACAYSYWKFDDTVSEKSSVPTLQDLPVKAYFVKSPAPWMDNQEERLELKHNTGYEEALEFYNNGDILIRFGRVDEEHYKYAKGSVEPLCGEIRIQISELSDMDWPAQAGGGSAVQFFYYAFIKEMWFSFPDMEDLSWRYVEFGFNSDSEEDLKCKIGGGGDNCETHRPGAAAKQQLINHYQAKVNSMIDSAYESYLQRGLDLEIGPEVLERGWGGAGIWYNTVARINGKFINSVMTIPSASSYPALMEDVQDERSIENSASTGEDIFRPSLSDGKRIDLEGDEGLGISDAEAYQIALQLSNYFTYWYEDDANQARQDRSMTQSIFENTIHLIFGTEGLMEMRGENAQVHPLAQLSSLGKGLVDHAIRNVAISTFTGFMGGPLKALQSTQALGALADVGTSFLSTTAFVGVTAGFILYYVLPFFPFLYFFFAVGQWVKGIFEAMVGVPLWALAHLRLDGEGLPGQAAAEGYFLLFDIFLRPIMTVMALVASLVVFTAQVRVLNFIWELVVDNAAGYSSIEYMDQQIQRGIIDQFFFTILYAIIVYMLATASFKLINEIPNGILRWMSSGASTFGDMGDDPTDGLKKYAAVGGLTIGQQVTDSVQQLGSGLGGATGQGIRKLDQALGGGPKNPGQAPQQRAQQQAAADAANKDGEG